MCIKLPNFTPIHCQDMAVFRFFKMAVVRHIGFSTVWNFNYQCGSGGQHASPCQIRCVSDNSLRRYDDFSRWRPSTILDFQKFKLFTDVEVQRANMRHHAKFRADRSIHCRDMAIFDFARWRPSAILDFYMHIGTTHDGYWVVSITVQNSVEIDTDVSTMWTF